MDSFNLIIIGGGPGGYVAAVRGAQLGFRVAVVENRDFGGTCLNRGCIPTKALIHAGRLYHESQNFAEIGLSAEKVSFDFPRIHARKNSVVAKLRDGVEQLLKANKVTIIHGTATIMDGHTVAVGGERYRGERLLIASGGTPAKPSIDGLDLPNVMTSDDLLFREDELLPSLLIIGGGVIGVEFATFYNALGSEVTIVEAQDRLLPTMEKDIGQNLAVSLKKRGVAIHTGASVARVTEGNGLTCYFTKKQQAMSVAAAGILVATGRQPNTAGLFGPAFSVELERGYIVVDEDFRTNVESVYAIGDVAAGAVQLAHYASAMGTAAVEKMAGLTPSVNLGTVPECVYTYPEIAAVGLTEAAAKEAGIPVKTGKFLMSANGKSLIEQEERGFVKVVCQAETDVLIGAQLMCGRATDLIGELAVAVANQLTEAQLTATIHPHPTFCEGLAEAYEDVAGCAIHNAPRRK